MVSTQTEISVPVTTLRQSLSQARWPRFALLLAFCLIVWLSDLSGAANWTYAKSAFVQLVTAGFCLGAARRFPSERQRWRLVAMSMAVRSLPYIAATAQYEGWLSPHSGSWLGNLGNAVATILLIPALMGRRGGQTNALRFLDLSMMALTALLLMATYGSGVDPGNGDIRVWTGIVLVATITLLAFSLRFADARPGLRRFTVIMVRFLMLELLDTVLINVILRNYFPRTPDVVVDVLIPLPELLLCVWVFGREPAQPLHWFRLDRTIVDSMQPSVLTVLSVMLALYAFRHQPLLAALSVIVTVVCSAVRTQMYYAELFEERSRLLSKATEYQELATRDPLTGIGNRRWFEANLQAALSNPDSFPCTLLLVDTDHFKLVNDSHGHDKGDTVLCAIASILERETDSTRHTCAARIGGDEFVLLLRNTEEQAAHVVAERVRTSVMQFSQNHGYPVTVSVGGRTVYEAVSRKDLLQAADDALYRAKAAGRNSVHGLAAV